VTYLYLAIAHICLIVAALVLLGVVLGMVDDIRARGRR